MPLIDDHPTVLPSDETATGSRAMYWWALVAVGVLFAANALQTAADPDLWGHLQFGLAHREDGQLARFDPYSYTTAGHPWTNHEWLTEWSFACVYTWLGPAGLMLLRAVLLGATVLGVGVICVRRKMPPAAFLLLAMFGVTVTAEFFRVRPQMYTYALMAWLLVICDSYRLGHRWTLWLVPPMIVAWTNLHGGFVAGLGVFGVYWLSFVVEAWGGPRRRQELAYLGAVLACSWAATLVNPYGIDYWRYVLFAVSLDRPAITEWRSVFAHNGILQMIYLALAIIPAVLWLYGTRRGHWVETALFALGVVLAGRHVRHVPFLLLFASLVLARRTPEVVALWGPRFRRLQAFREPSPWPAFGFFLVLLMAGVGGGWKLGRNLAALPSEGALVVSAQDYPVQAVEFMQRNGIGGNLDCGFNWGEYCIFKLYPQCRVFCDGRYETVYPKDVSRLALATEGEENWRSRVEGYPTDLILAPKNDPFGHWAANHKEFVEVYSDDTARLLVRRSPQNSEFLKAWRESRLKTASQSPPKKPFPA